MVEEASGDHMPVAGQKRRALTVVLAESVSGLV